MCVMSLPLGRGGREHTNFNMLTNSMHANLPPRKMQKCVTVVITRHKGSRKERSNVTNAGEKSKRKQGGRGPGRKGGRAGQREAG